MGKIQDKDLLNYLKMDRSNVVADHDSSSQSSDEYDFNVDKGFFDSSSQASSSESSA